MKWTPGGRSTNLDDRRSGGGMGRGLGIGGTVVVLALSLLFGRNLFTDLGVQPGVGGAGGAAMTAEDSIAQDTAVQFMSFLLDDIQGVWAKKLPQLGTPYKPARLAIFRNSTESGCGPAQSAMGPFYCPLDERVYLDLGFYDQLKRYGAPGQTERGTVSSTSDFAQAYVLAHELGHHVQHVLGTDARMRQAQQSNPSQANELSVRMELQADCYAGVWANSTSQRDMLDPGDIDEALGAASAVGDDRIQQQTTGQVNVDAFTHGSAAQRSEWFKRGFESGDPRNCTTI